MTQQELDKIVEQHQHWLKEDCEGWEDMRANLREADLTGADQFRLGKKKRAGISEKAFVKAVRELYPNVLFHKLDEKDFDDVWIRGIGYWEAERVLYSRSEKNIRMWRNFGAYDYNFKNLDDFKVWLKNAYADNRKFEETPEATK